MTSTKSYICGSLNESKILQIWFPLFYSKTNTQQIEITFERLSRWTRFDNKFVKLFEGHKVKIS